MAVNLTDIKTRINGMTDLSDIAFNDLFVDYDSTVVSQDDVYAELEKKIVELFEQFANGKDDATIAAEITAIKGRISSSGRLDTKGATIETKLKDVAKDISDINGKISGLNSHYADSDDTYITGLLADISAIQSKAERERFYRTILDSYRDNYFAMNADAAAAVNDAQAFWTSMNSIVSRGPDSLNSVVSYADYGVEVGKAFTNVQNGHVGAYKELLDEIKTLETNLGAFDDEAKIDAEINRLDTTEVTNIENAFKLGIYSDMQKVIDNGIENFIEVASDTEISDFKADLATAITMTPVLGDSRLESLYNDAIAKLTAASTGRTAKAKADIENDITNTLQPAYDSKKTELDAAEADLADETYKVNEVYSKSSSDLNAAKTGLLAQKATPGLTPEQIADIDKKVAFIDAELTRRGTDPLLELSTSDLNDRKNNLLSSLSLPANYNVSDERDNRNWLIENVLNAKLEDVCSYDSVNDKYGKPLNSSLEAEIRSRFGDAKADVIINTFIENEFFAVGARVSAYNVRHEWWSACSTDELAEMRNTRRRLDGTTPLSGDELIHILDTIDARKEIPNRDWFVSANGFLTSDELDEIEKIDAEVANRVGNVATLTATRDSKKADLDVAEKALNDARAQVYSRDNFDNYNQKKTNRANALAANTAARNKLDTNLRADAKKLKMNREVKDAYDKILTDAEAHFNGNDKVEQADIDAFVNGHSSLAVLNTHPKAADLKAQLVSEIGRRVNKVKQVTNNGTNKFKWGRALAGAAGLFTGLTLSCVPGVAPIMMGVSMAKLAGNVVTKGINLWANKHPNGKVDNFINGRGGKISQFVKKCRDKLSGDFAKGVNWFLNGVAIGYMAGNYLGLADKIPNGAPQNPTTDPALVPEPLPNVITADSINDLSALQYASEGPGEPFERILSRHVDSWKNAKWDKVLWDSSLKQPLVHFTNEAVTTGYNGLGFVTPTQLSDINFSIDPELQAAIDEVIARHSSGLSR